MRTAHLLPVSPSMHCSGGVPAQGVYLRRRCTCPGGCTCPGVCTCPGGCTCPGRGVPAQVLSPLWTKFLTHAFENISLPQTLFAAVKNRPRGKIHLIFRQIKLKLIKSNFAKCRLEVFLAFVYKHLGQQRRIIWEICCNN